MRDSLSSENSFIIDRNWQRVNTKNELTVSVEQAKLFLKLLVQDHEKLKKINQANAEQWNEAKVMDKIELFLFKYIQEKELASAKRELPSIQKGPYRLSLTDCLEIWRWVSEDSTSYRTKEFDDAMNVNQFEIGNSFQAIEIKKNVDYSSKNKKIFSELSLEEQEVVLKKTLQMVHLYYHQFKIIFNHYCKFSVENEHKRTFTFDDMPDSLSKMNINRFMLFCREFDILKTLQFKRKTEHNPSMSKDFLAKVFKKNAHLQRSLVFESFLMTLVNISIKIHENFDPRSYMHIELFLNSLKVRYYEQFVAKLDSLHIKYTPTEFYNCYRHIFNKQSIKRKKEGKKALFNNPYLTKQEPSHKTQSDDIMHESLMFNQKGLKGESRMIKYNQSVPNLLGNYQGLTQVKKESKTLQKRKVSVPLLPSLQQNRYFKPIEHNYHLNSYNSYLQKVEDTSSVFKNRITGYSNINHLKSKPFHANNPQTVSKSTLDDLLAKKKLNIQKNGSLDAQYGNEAGSKIISNDSLVHQHLLGNSDKRVSTVTTSKFLKKQEKLEALESLKQKIDVGQSDELLNKHLTAEQHSREQQELRHE